MPNINKQFSAIDHLAYINELVALFGRHMDTALTFVDDVPDVLREQLTEAFTNVKQAIRTQCEAVSATTRFEGVKTYPSGKPMWEYTGLGGYRLIPPDEAHINDVYRAEVV